MTSYTTILVDIEDRLATVTFNRPDQRNAISYEGWLDLARISKEIDGDDDGFQLRCKMHAPIPALRVRGIVLLRVLVVIMLFGQCDSPSGLVAANRTTR